MRLYNTTACKGTAPCSAVPHAAGALWRPAQPQQQLAVHPPPAADRGRLWPHSGDGGHHGPRVPRQALPQPASADLLSSRLSMPRAARPCSTGFDGLRGSKHRLILSMCTLLWRVRPLLASRKMLCTAVSAAALLVPAGLSGKRRSTQALSPLLLCLGTRCHTNNKSVCHVSTLFLGLLSPPSPALQAMPSSSQLMKLCGGASQGAGSLSGRTPPC